MVRTDRPCTTNLKTPDTLSTLACVLRAKLFNYYAQLVNQTRVLVPVTIGRVEHSRFANQRDGQEHLIRPIERIFREFFKPPSVIVRRRHPHSSHTTILVLMVKYVLEECITHARLPRVTQIASILAQDEARATAYKAIVLSTTYL